MATFDSSILEQLEENFTNTKTIIDNINENIEKYNNELKQNENERQNLESKRLNIEMELGTLKEEKLKQDKLYQTAIDEYNKVKEQIGKLLILFNNT
jgi:chromosome segregation ATPase